MKPLEFFRQLRVRLKQSPIRDDLLMIALSVVMAIGLTLIWISGEPAQQSVNSGEPEVPIQQASPSTPPPVEKTSPLVPFPSGQTAAGNGAPLVAIVIDDMGPNARTARAMTLPPAITFAFLPYAPQVVAQTEAARKAGHEILVHVPMEPVGQADPGPHALKVDEAAEDLRATLLWNLGRFNSYVGINNHMGSRFTADEASMRIVMAELKTRNLMFLDSRTTSETKAAAIAREMGVPVVSRDVFLDNEEGSGEVEAELARLEKIAREKGSAIAIGHPHEATLDVLEKWIPEAEKRGFALVPLTEILKHRQKQ